MRIAYIGWGSLIWDPGDLPIQGEWLAGGPILPLEFSRISTSRNRALTLVIDPDNGVMLPTCFARSSETDLDKAIGALRDREGNPSRQNIGYVNVTAGTARCTVWPKAKETIEQWARNAGFDAVVWTDLPSNFDKKNPDGVTFTVDAAFSYLKRLPADGQEAAREYISKASKFIRTPLRDRVEAEGWLNVPAAGME